MVYDGNKSYIFVSYSHDDKKLVNPMIDALCQKGFRVWYDSGIEAGSEWPEYIEERLSHASVVLVVMTPAAVQSRNCRNEINLALDLKKEVLVVYLQETTLQKGMRLQLNSTQSLYRSNHTSEQSFLRALTDARILQGCRDAAAKPNNETYKSASATPSTGSSYQAAPRSSGPHYAAPHYAAPPPKPAPPKPTASYPTKSQSSGVDYDVTKKIIFGIVAVVLVAWLFGGVIWPKVISPKLSNPDLYTPEILQSYSGNYQAENLEGRGILTISSCDADGKITGFFEIITKDDYGKCALSGKIEEKKRSGVLTLSVSPGEWVVQPATAPTLDTMEITVSGDYTNLYCAQYDFKWYESDSGSFAIKTPQDLKKLAGSSETFCLQNDIDMGGAVWTPIEGFTGTLIGSGYTIKNFSIDTMQNNAGLFATLEGAVRNLTIQDAKISVTGRTERVGVLCGTLNGTVTNINIVSCEINAPNSDYVGAVAGYVSGFASNAKVNNLSSDSAVVGRDYVGGIFGSVTPACHGEGDSVIFSNISNKGAITGENCVGGLFGHMYFNGKHAVIHYDFPAYILSVSNEGNVTGKTKVGGIVGHGQTDTYESYIKNSSNKAAIVADAMVGCIGGYCDLTVDSCTNEGSTLTANGFFMENGEKVACVGGYVGKGAVIQNCTNTVEINYIAGGKFVGGIMGQVVGYPKNAMLSKLTNKANITGYNYVGGIFGSVSPGCNGDGDSIAFNTMKNEGAISGNDYVGGIMGHIYTNGSHAIVHYDFPIYLTGMENLGAVEGNDCVGGIIGYGRTDTTVSELISSTSVDNVKGSSNVGNLIGKAEKITVR